MDKARKGNRGQNFIAQHLQKNGFVTQTTVRRPIWVKTPAGMKVIGSKNNDFFNVFDLIAIGKYGGGQVVFVQVTDYGTFWRKIKTIDEAFSPKEYGNLAIRLYAKRAGKIGVWRSATRSMDGWCYQDFKVRKDEWFALNDMKSRKHGEPIEVEE